MAGSALPENWQDLVAGAVLGNLSDEETAAWEALLEEYPELADELAEFQATFDGLAEAVPLQQPPDRVLSQIRGVVQAELDIAAATEEAPQLLNVKEPRRATARLRVLAPLGGAIAASIIAVLGIQLSALRSQLQQADTQLQQVNRQVEALEQELQQAQQYAKQQTQALTPVVQTLQQTDSLIYSLKGSPLADAASGRLVVADNQEVIIVVKNLPELPTGEVYRLWADLPTETNLLYCGQFNSNSHGVIQLKPSSMGCGANPTQMLITVDAVTDPTTKGGPVVMQGLI